MPPNFAENCRETWDSLPSECLPSSVCRGKLSYTLTSQGGAKVEVHLKAKAFFTRRRRAAKNGAKTQTTLGANTALWLKLGALAKKPSIGTSLNCTDGNRCYRGSACVVRHAASESSAAMPARMPKTAVGCSFLEKDKGCARQRHQCLLKASMLGYELWGSAALLSI